MKLQKPKIESKNFQLPGVCYLYKHVAVAQKYFHMG